MGLEVSVFFALGALLCWAFGDFLIQRSTRKVGDVESIAFIGLIGGVFLFPFVIKDFHLLLSLSNLLLLLLFGIIIFVTTFFDFEALREGKLSIIDVVIEIELPITIILGLIFFKETLSVIQLTLIAFIFAGIILVATKSFSHWKTKLEKGVLIAFFAAIGMGFSNFLVSSSSRQISPLLTIWAAWTLTAIISLIYIYFKKGSLKCIKDAKKFKWLVLAMGIFDTAAWIFYSFAVLKNEISIVTAITESYPALAMFLGFWLNKEKINEHQWIGAAIALSASFTLAFLL